MMNKIEEIMDAIDMSFNTANKTFKNVNRVFENNSIDSTIRNYNLYLSNNTILRNIQIFRETFNLGMQLSPFIIQLFNVKESNDQPSIGTMFSHFCTAMAQPVEKKEQSENISLNEFMNILTQDSKTKKEVSKNDNEKQKEKKVKTDDKPKKDDVQCESMDDD